MENYDFIIVGAGLFGIYSAIYLDSKGYRVYLIDKEPEPWRKASVINQARSHSGYHYPRSVSTALLAREYRNRFNSEHAEFINTKFKHFYSIDSYGSLTSSNQFERFAKYLDLKLKKSSLPYPLSENRITSSYESDEFSFDPFLLRRFYIEKLKATKVTYKWNTRVINATKNKSSWEIELFSNKINSHRIKASNVINATYSDINAVNQVFNVDNLSLIYETSEIVFLYAPELAEIGLTVMDGPFLSILPYGQSGLHSLTSVIYTHHDYMTTKLSKFDSDNYMESKNHDISNSTVCFRRPQSNSRKMLKQLNNYLSAELTCFNHGSLFTVKTKLSSSYINDSRPTTIMRYMDNPGYFVLFSGKVSSMYEVERLWN